MQRRWASLTLLIAFSGCAPRREEPANENMVEENRVVAPDAVTPATTDPESVEGAGQVLQRFGALLEQGKFAAARQSWSDGGRASGLTEAEFAEAYDQYAELHADIGAPGEPEGAAGSIYVEIPLRLYGTLRNGKPFNLVGPVVLRRVNDVPGSSAAQREWHITRSDLKPRA